MSSINDSLAAIARQIIQLDRAMTRRQRRRRILGITAESAPPLPPPPPRLTAGASVAAVKEFYRTGRIVSEARGGRAAAVPRLTQGADRETVRRWYRS